MINLVEFLLIVPSLYFIYLFVAKFACVYIHSVS
jgi:hypothetical protein